MKPRSELLARLGLRLPIVQAPMAGVSSPAMAAAAGRAGGLGSIGVGGGDAAAAEAMIHAVRKLGEGPLNVNVFCHAPARRDATVEAAWIARLRPRFEALGASPPTTLREIYCSFVTDDAMLEVLLDARPTVVSFHFGLPGARAAAALRQAGIVLLGSATNGAEAKALEAAGMDAIVAQGWDAGGHRGVFDPDAPDAQLDALTLVRRLVGETTLPVIAAGGIMDGADIAKALRAGAVAAQLGTAFVASDESLADAGYRAALTGPAASRTVMTRAISGRPARCLANRFTELGEDVPAGAVPGYPVAYDLGKALNAAAKARGEFGFGAQWAGQGAPRTRRLSTAALMATLEAELDTAS